MLIIHIYFEIYHVIKRRVFNSLSTWYWTLLLSSDHSHIRNKYITLYKIKTRFCDWKMGVNERKHVWMKEWINEWRVRKKINEHTTTVNIRMKHLNTCLMLLLITNRKTRQEDWTFKRKKTCFQFSVTSSWVTFHKRFVGLVCGFGHNLVNYFYQTKS